MLVVVLKRAAKIAKTISLQGIFFQFNLTSMNSQYLDVRTTTFLSVQSRPRADYFSLRISECSFSILCFNHSLASLFRKSFQPSTLCSLTESALPLSGTQTLVKIRLNARFGTFGEL